jgi:hypothetical protein
MSRRSASAAALVAAAALAAVPGAAQAKHATPKLAEAMYTVKAHATLDERWSYDELAGDLCLEGCTRETKGSGLAHLDLAAKPTRWLVMRGVGGRPPAIDVGTGEGAALEGIDRRSGDLSTVYGGQWAAGNPPEVAPNGGCGDKDVSFDLNLTFTGKTELAPVATPDLTREDCPDGPSSGLLWKDDVPTLSDVTTTTSPTRFLSVRSFTVGGSRTWSTAAEPADGNVTRTGIKTVTWKWEVTFTMDAKKKKKARHR